MPSLLSAPKNPTKSAAGRLGARARWANHEPRTVKLDDLTPEQRRLVFLLLDAVKTAGTPGDG